MAFDLYCTDVEALKIQDSIQVYTWKLMLLSFTCKILTQCFDHYWCTATAYWIPRVTDCAVSAAVSVSTQKKGP